MGAVRLSDNLAQWPLVEFSRQSRSRPKKSYREWTFFRAQRQLPIIGSLTVLGCLSSETSGFRRRATDR